MDAFFPPIQLKVNPAIYVKEPESSALGKAIISEGIRLIHELGFEHFTLKKLAEAIGTTESSIYRYFENKHKLLLYITSWYWIWVEYRMVLATVNVLSPEEQLHKALEVFIYAPEKNVEYEHMNVDILYRIVVEEAPKSYLTRDVDAENQLGVYLVYKRICKRLVSIVQAINPEYVYPHSLISLVMDGLHREQYYAAHLPTLCDAKTPEALLLFSKNLVLSTIKHS